MSVQGDYSAPFAVQLRGSAFARRVLSLFGWRVRFEGLPTLQGVIVVYPHTSNWDFIVALLAKWSVGLPLHFWAKDTLFRIPVFGAWLRWVGGIAVLRHAPAGVVSQVLTRMQLARDNNDLLWLALSPEGTRRWTAGWRSGFYQVAQQSGLPLGVFRLDYLTRELVATSFINLTGDVQADMSRIATILDGVRGKCSALASPVQLLPSFHQDGNPNKHKP